jgi:hypothetical protein
MKRAPAPEKGNQRIACPGGEETPLPSVARGMTAPILLTDFLADGAARGVIDRYQSSRRFRKTPGSGHS